MTTEIRTLSINRTINAPVELVYRAFTNAQLLRQWFCDVATVAPKAGGRFYVAWHSGNALLGKYLEVAPNEKVVLQVRSFDDTDRSQITVTFSTQAEGTEVHLSDVSDGGDWQKISQEIERGWHEALDNLKAVLEDGIDLREANRPMLGIYFAEQKPGDLGFRIGGVIDGMDAQKAGLQKDDLLLSLAGKPTRDWDELTAALQPQRVGNTVEICFLRGAEQKTVTVKLSLRPMPELPANPAALADKTRKAYAEVNAALTELLADVDEERAGLALGPGEWSVKQTLAHLLAGEHDLHGNLSATIGGQERWQDEWEGNLPVRVNAVIQTRPTISALLQEFTCSQTETIVILAGLPAEFVAQKRSYRRMAEWMTGWIEHMHEHLAELRSGLSRMNSA